MMRKLVLISHPERPAVSRDLAAYMHDRYGAAHAEICWLAPDIACEFNVSDDALTPTTIRENIGDQPLDIALVGANSRQIKLFIADMDSTIIEQECIDEMADKFGLKAQISAITDKAMRGDMNFDDALRQRVALLAGLAVAELAYIASHQLTFSSGAKTVLATLRSKGIYTALVSGGFTPFTAHICEQLGFDTHRSNQLELANNRLTGRVLPPILGADAKRKTLVELCHQRQHDITHSLCVGDGANDIPMLNAAGIGVAYHGKPQVGANADIAINHADLTALLYIQGIAAREFVT